MVTPLIVSSWLWAFSYEQARQYVGIYAGVTTESGATQALAAIPMPVNERYPALFNHGNIERARKELASAGDGGECPAEFMK